MSNELNYEEIEKTLNMINYNHYKTKYEQALKRSMQIVKEIEARRIQRKKKDKIIKRTALASAIAVAATISVPLSKAVIRQNTVNKAIDYQKQEIAMMIEKGNTKFSEDQMLGLIDLYGYEAGVQLATGENWQDYCIGKGYTEIVSVSENGTYADRAPSIRVLKNYKEEDAIKRMQENTDENGNFVFPTLNDNTDDMNNGGKLI